MRYFNRILLFTVLVCALTACTGARVGVVNPSRLFQDSESGKAGIAHLKKIETDMQARLTTAQELLKKSPDDEVLRSRFQQVFAGYQQLITAEQQKVVESINNQMQAALESCRARKRMTAILNGESALTYAPDADVTDAVLTEMNSAPLSFAPVELEELSAPVEKSGKATSVSGTERPQVQRK